MCLINPILGVCPGNAQQLEMTMVHTISIAYQNWVDAFPLEPLSFLTEASNPGSVVQISLAWLSWVYNPTQPCRTSAI